MAGAFPQQEFGQLKSQARLAKIADAKRTDYWGGSTWVYNTTLTNGGTLGTLQIEVVPGEDNEMEVLYGTINNLDTASRIGIMRITDPNDSLLYLGTVESVVVGQHIPFPEMRETTGSDEGGSSQRLLVSGDMKFLLQSLTVAASEDARFALVARVRGEKPGVTPTFTFGGNQVIHTDRFF